jgi:hypothetical protein
MAREDTSLSAEVGPKRKRAPRKDAYYIVASRRYRLLPVSTFNGTDFIVRRFFRAGL